MSKVCKCCGSMKSLGEFYAGRAQCKACVLIHTKERRAIYRNTHKSQMAEYQARYYKVNRETMLAKQAEYSRNNRDKNRIKQARWAIDNPERVKELRREAQHKRRARLRNVEVERGITLSLVFQRYDGVCGICSTSCLLQEATIDHIIPIAKGGSHTLDNVQLAHLSCNLRKHDRAPWEIK